MEFGVCRLYSNEGVYVLIVCLIGCLFVSEVTNAMLFQTCRGVPQQSLLLSFFFVSYFIVQILIIIQFRKIELCVKDLI